MTRSRRPKLTTNNDSDQETAILEAVIACIQRYGLEKTTMEDIASAAGVSRISIYRKFGNRNNLVNGVLGYRAKQFNHRIKDRMLNAPSLEEALVIYLMATCEQSKKDVSIRIIVETPHVYHAILDDPQSPMRLAVAEVWKPLLKHFGGKELSISTVQIADIVEWIIIMQTNFSRIAIETSCSMDHIQKMIRNFVAPAFLLRK